MNNIILLLLLSLPLLHDFHMSRLDLHYKSDQQSMQFSLFMFIDDFEATIKEHEDNVDLKLFTKKESTVADSLIYNYISKNLLINVDNNIKTMNYIGKEIDEKDLQGMWIYLEIDNQKTFESLDITNSILTDAFSDQRNIINVLVDSKRKGYHILDKKNNSQKIKL